MNSTCHKITINSESYYVHSAILKQYHFFTKLLDDNINIQLTLLNISVQNIIDSLYLQYYGKSDSLTYKQFVEILNIFDYFHPINPKIMYDMIYYYIIQHDISDDEIIKSSCNDIYKTKLLKSNSFKKFANDKIKLEYGAGWGFNSDEHEYNIIEFCAKRGVTINHSDIKLDWGPIYYPYPQTLHEYKLLIKNINIEIVPDNDEFTYGDIKKGLLKFCKEYDE